MTPPRTAPRPAPGPAAGPLGAGPRGRLRAFRPGPWKTGLLRRAAGAACLGATAAAGLSGAGCTSVDYARLTGGDRIEALEQVPDLPRAAYAPPPEQTAEHDPRSTLGFAPQTIRDADAPADYWDLTLPRGDPVRDPEQRRRPRPRGRRAPQPGRRPDPVRPGPAIHRRPVRPGGRAGRVRRPVHDRAARRQQRPDYQQPVRRRRHPAVPAGPGGAPQRVVQDDRHRHPVRPAGDHRVRRQQRPGQRLREYLRPLLRGRGPPAAAPRQRGDVQPPRRAGRRPRVLQRRGHRPGEQRDHRGRVRDRPAGLPLRRHQRLLGTLLRLPEPGGQKAGPGPRADRRGHVPRPGRRRSGGRRREGTARPGAILPVPGRGRGGAGRPADRVHVHRVGAGAAGRSGAAAGCRRPTAGCDC